jgi:hypothetical protein
MEPLTWRAMGAFGTASLVALLSLTGCGSDAASDGSAGTEATAAPTTSADDAATPTADEQAFCDAHLALAKALSGPPSDEVDVGALAAALQEAAPDDLSDTVATFLEVGQRAGEQGDDSLFLSDEFRDPGRAMDEAVAGSCGYPVYDIRAVDYGFEGVPDTMEPGPTMLHFTNDGADLHEGYLFRRADGVEGEPVDLLNADPSNGSGDLEEVAVTHIGPAGDESYLTADLEPGSYVLACFFPQGVASVDDLAGAGEDPSMDHRSGGMIVGFEVA